MTTGLSPQRYLESIDSDTERLLEVAERGLDAPVPCCEGWTVSDVVSHVGAVYRHKVRVMADSAWPDPWPPKEFEGRPPLEFLREAKSELFEEFSQHEPTDETATFGADTTIGFWLRRMALEIAIHRYDGELAHGDVSPIAEDIALDGIDEVLQVMLAGPWWGDELTDYPVEAVVTVEAGGRSWLCDVRAREVSIRSGATTEAATTEAAATVSGQPADLFLWLWGRVADDRVTLTGDTETIRAFRARLVEATQ